MQAVILAAGMGKRLKGLTKGNTKCMIKVNGVTLIERMLSQLDALGLERIIIVVGYKGQELIDYIGTLNISTRIEYVDNRDYSTTNNIYSFYLAKDYLDRDTLLLESDLIFDDSILGELVNDPRPSLALVDRYQSWMDGTCVILDKEDNITRFVSKEQFAYSKIKDYFKTVNVYKFSRDFLGRCYIPFLKAYIKAFGYSEYYENVLKILCFSGSDFELKAKRLTGASWYEIDDIQDLDIAESIFSKERRDKLGSRFGGYWRYPNIVDFCYLVNPYFPNSHMIDEMKASFFELLTQYPSGARVNTLLASKNFNVPMDNILVGNGAAELISGLMQIFEGKLGIIRPTFEEYSHRYSGPIVEYHGDPARDYRYDAKDLIEFFSVEDNHIDNLILINPDNPTGNFLAEGDLELLLQWADSQNVRIVVDESFVDFAEEPYTLLGPEFMEHHRNLVVIKSISKSYGVPGIRLGIMASGDTELIKRVAAVLPIWNINSFGEFFMQIMEKYNDTYRKAMAQFRESRRRFVCELESIPNIKVFESQANYLMIRLPESAPCAYVCDELLNEYGILVKDISGKLNGDNMIRVAIRTTEDNKKFCEALKSLIILN